MAFDTRIYFGRPGALAALRPPRGTVDATRVRRTSAFGLGRGGVSIDQVVGGARTYTLNYEQLTREDYSTLQAFLDGHEGPGPFALLDPGQRNMLPANIAAATSVTNGIDGGPTGSFQLLGLSDDLTNNAVTSSGWGQIYTGQTLAYSGGTLADYYRDGSYAHMALPTTGTARIVRYSNVGPNVRFTLYNTFASTAPMTGAQASNQVRFRNNGSTWYEVNVQYQTNGTVTLYILRTATTLTSLTAFAPYDSSTVFGVKAEAIGAQIKFKVWDASADEPDDWTYETTDYGVPGTSSDYLELISQRISGNTNSSLVSSWRGITIEAPFGTLSSSSTYTDAGPRSLNMNFSAAPTGGVAADCCAIGIDWPSSTFQYGVPVVAGRSLCFSGYIRGGGGDPISTWTPRFVWRDALGALVGATSGTPVASSSGAWAQWYVAGAPPTGTVYADMMLNYTSGALSTAQIFLRRLMLNEGSTPDTTWTPGTGVWPVRFTGMPDAWPMLSPELRAGPVAVLQEDVS